MNKHLVVLDIVGLTPALIGEHTPHIQQYAQLHTQYAMQGVFPALTTSAQSSLLTGKTPAQHGIVGNGWYDREMAEVAFWKQPNQLVQAEKIWETLKANDPAFRCSQLFWWYNMYAKVDASITPRPHYPADGRKIIDLYSTPAGLHQQLESTLGKFPFFNFWGPKAGIPASQWIADAAMLEFELHQPHLQLVYLPHLDYCLQKFGPEHTSIAQELQAIDKVVGKLLAFYQSHNADVVLLSEYGIEAVDTPVHINRVLRQAGYIAVRDSLSWELLDPGASSAFAVADHQIAHVYINDKTKLEEVKVLLQSTPGIDYVLDKKEQTDWHVNHERSGDLVAVAEKGAWFTYYYWLHNSRAPDFAPTVDIHRKPGYDPAEMFFDPSLKFPVLKVMWRLLQKKLGMRMLMDVIPIEADMVKGSHGRLADDPALGPVFIAPKEFVADVKGNELSMLDVHALVEAYFNRPNE